MSSIPSEHLAKARQCLDEGRKILAVEVVYAAGRNAYIAVFHAALAFIVHKTGKNIKTHSGARSEFARLAKDEPQIDRAFTTFLAQSYNLKTVADYGVGVENTFSIAEAESALDMAEKFINCIDLLVRNEGAT